VIPLAISVGLAYYWTKSFKVPLLIHVLYNGVLAVISALASNVADTSAADQATGFDVSSLVLGCAGLVAVVVALVAIYRQTHVSLDRLPPPLASQMVDLPVQGETRDEPMDEVPGSVPNAISRTYQIDHTADS